MPPAVRQPGLLQKYAHRALMVTTPDLRSPLSLLLSPPFRLPVDPAIPGSTGKPAFDQLAADTEIHEIILSGGDPLCCPTPRLHELIDQLSSIPHLQRLRIHTRLPVVIPQRITAPLVQLPGPNTTDTVVVIHANHPAELDSHCGRRRRPTRPRRHPTAEPVRTAARCQ